MIKLRGAAVAAVMAGVCATGTTTAQESEHWLHAPFRTPEARTAPPASGCPAVADPPISLHIDTPYQKGDPTFSHIDPQAEAAVNALMKPIRDFDVKVDVQANRYVFSDGANVGAGACALAMMDDWAKRKAVTQLTGHDAYLFRANMITALSIDYMQVRGLDTGDPSQRARIRAWLHNMAEDSLEHWRTLPPDSMVNHNNHRAWAALAAATAGAASNDRALLDWGVTSAKIVACEADSDGALPREIGRAARARLYSLYAAEPLVMTAEFAQANGVDLYHACNNAIIRIANFALQSIDDPSAVEAKAGVRQEAFFRPDGGFNQAQIGWGPVYAHRFSQVRLSPRLSTGQPMFAPDLGGSVGVLFSR